ncbi:nuclear transport factor 2 family protein [Chamaesiphon sp. VAR_48_metabat_403]|uniref:YybH family protein n=1 Tax=Chamaesiphon sp. VAR_48_metabat_403 TaxID=2964700 RepID=UPI00286EA17A|nr:nuclear transport factor 2 family protein [Chamaesiphon sp. VAR_48_metabat_403]
MMKTLRRSIFAMLLIAILSLWSMQPAQAVPNDIELLKQGVAAWEKGWSSGDTPFSMDRVDNLYVKTDDFLEFDTLSPAGTVTQSYQSFQHLWEPTMQAATHSKTAIDDNLKINTDGKMGLTTFTFQTEFTDRQTGKKYAEHAHASMVWEKQDDRWVILHEHVSSPVRMS